MMILKMYSLIEAGLKVAYQEAKQKDKTLTGNDVKKWFEENVERSKQFSGYNSFVARYAMQNMNMRLICFLL